MQDEPYWADLVELITWANDHTTAMVLSCLSAHAALTVFDGIERVRLPTKCTGVFAQQVEQHGLCAGVESEVLLPHSRLNTVPHLHLEGAGYDIAVHSEQVGWSIATRDQSGCQVVLVQGHPEYDPASLLFEYRRDAGRYVRRERDDLPILPYHCVADEDWEQLQEVERAILDGGRDPAIVDSFPFEEVAARAPWPWRAMAKRFYANLLASVARRED